MVVRYSRFGSPQTPRRDSNCVHFPLRHNILWWLIPSITVRLHYMYTEQRTGPRLAGEIKLENHGAMWRCEVIHDRAVPKDLHRAND